MPVFLMTVLVCLNYNGVCMYASVVWHLLSLATDKCYNFTREPNVYTAKQGIKAEI